MTEPIEAPHYVTVSVGDSKIRFAAVGRTALSNYLPQSVVCTTLFYSWGGALYGTVSPLAGLVITLPIYAAQVVLSVLYMKRFHTGPMEWLWRRLTYGGAAFTAVGRRPAGAG